MIVNNFSNPPASTTIIYNTHVVSPATVVRPINTTQYVNTVDPTLMTRLLAIENRLDSAVQRPLLSSQSDSIVDSVGRTIAHSIAQIPSVDLSPLEAAIAALSVSFTGIDALLSGTLTVDGASTFDTDTLVIDNINNRVGVGTSSPTDTLSVNGAIYLANTTPSVTGNRIYANAGDLYYAGSLIGGATTGNWATNGTDVYRATGNVGIGTTSPYAKLSVVGQVVAEYFHATSTTATSTFAGGLVAGNGSLNMLQNGNMGIGLSTPSYKLDINGDVNVARGSAYKYNGSNVIIASTTLNNYFFGASGNLTASGGNNTALGYTALLSHTSGTGNVALGHSAMFSNTTGFSNVALGYNSLYYNTTGSENTAIGSGALNKNTSGQWNVGLGVQALEQNTTGNDNFAVGTNAMRYNTVGRRNMGLGTSALEGNTTGSDNVAIGYATLADLNITAGDNSGNNTALGYNTGRGIITGVNNTIIGAQVTGLSSALSNNIIIADGSGNQRINVGSTGNVGIGTTSPYAKLSVEGSSALGNSATAGYFIATTTTASAFPYASTTALSVSGSGGQALTIGSGFQYFSSSSEGNRLLSNNGGGNYVGMSVSSSGGKSSTNIGYTSSLSTTLTPVLNVRDDSQVILPNSASQLNFSFASNGNKILFNNGGSVNAMALGVSSINSNVNSVLTFGSSGTTVMSVVDNGNVGIGTTSPYAKLSVVGPVVAEYFNATSTTATSTFAGGLVAGNGSLNVLQNGNMGVGTAVPGTPLEIYKLSNGILVDLLTLNAGFTGGSVTNSASRILFNNSLYGNMAAIRGQVSPGGGALDNEGDLVFQTATNSVLSDKLTIKYDGKVGIGTTTPSLPLHVYTTGTNLGTLFETTGAGYSYGEYKNSNGTMFIGKARDTSNGGLIGDGLVSAGVIATSNSSPLQFGINGTTRMTIATDSNVGIGTQTPSGKLHLYSSNANIYSVIETDWSTGYAYNNYNTLEGSFYIGKDRPSGGGLMTGSLGDAGIINVTTAQALQLGTNDTARLTILSGGNVGVGTTTPWRKLSVTGTVGFDGLSTSATGDAICITANKEITTAAGSACLGVSSQRFKHDISTLDLGLGTLMDLRPVSFRYNEGRGDSGKVQQFGLIAEETYAVDSRLAVLDAEGLPTTVRYDFLAPLLIKAVQEQQVQINALKHATATSALFEPTESFISTIATAVKNLLASAGEWMMTKITATLAIFNRVETEVAAVSKGLEMTDQVTGTIYCVTIANGDWLKLPGTCATASSTPPVATSTPPTAPSTPEIVMEVGPQEITPIIVPVSSSTPLVVEGASSTPPVIVLEPTPSMTPEVVALIPDPTVPPEPALGPEGASEPAPVGGELVPREIVSSEPEGSAL